MGINFNLPDDGPTETVWITCTDKDKTIQADIVSQRHNEIIMMTKDTGIRMSFRKANSFGKIKQGVWISNMAGLEFVYTE
jgi:hypothetical protein